MRTKVDNYRRRVESAGQATMTQTVKDGEPCANKTERLQQRLDQGKRERENRGVGVGDGHR